MNGYSTLELTALVLARDLRPEDRVIQSGANMPEGRAAAILAGLRFPGSRVIVDLAVENFAGGNPIPPVHPSSFDPRSLEFGEARSCQDTIFDYVARPEVFFVGGLEVDQRGNLNLLGRRDEQGRWDLRGPGTLALASMTTHASGYYIVMRRHEPRTFPSKVSLITALGDKQRRAQLGFPGGGPRLVVSPLGVFDFDERGDMRIKSLHPGVSQEAVADATGFSFEVTERPEVTPEPTPEELTVLRETIDPEGILR